MISQRVLARYPGAAWSASVTSSTTQNRYATANWPAFRFPEDAWAMYVVCELRSLRTGNRWGVTQCKAGASARVLLSAASRPVQQQRRHVPESSLERNALGGFSKNATLAPARTRAASLLSPGTTITRESMYPKSGCLPRGHAALDHDRVLTSLFASCSGCPRG
eukprot:scaffold2502_cov362-Prasinococcus_capsulatus_cf.AAC.10